METWQIMYLHLLISITVTSEGTILVLILPQGSTTWFTYHGLSNCECTRDNILLWIPFSPLPPSTFPPPPPPPLSLSLPHSLILFLSLSLPTDIPTLINCWCMRMEAKKIILQTCSSNWQLSKCALLREQATSEITLCLSSRTFFYI